jgi:superfamily II DNA or RNA helicase
VATSIAFADDPIPCARLWAGPVVLLRSEGLKTAEIEQVMPLIDLFFDCGGERIKARDFGGGAEARALLERLGAVEIEHADVLPPVDAEPDYVILGEETRDFCAFTASAVPKLRAMGWHVDIDPAYPFRVIRAPDAPILASVAPHAKKSDWFTLQLGIEIDGHKFDLVPIVLDILSEANEDDDLRAIERRVRVRSCVRVSATEHVLLPQDRLLALLRALIELHQGVRPKGNIIAFPASRAPILAKLEQSLGRDMILRDPAHVMDEARAVLEQPPEVEPPPTLQATLRPYQRAGVSYLQHLGKIGAGVLADDMGLGKTLQTITHLVIEKHEGRLGAPALVVCPTSLAWNWSREVAKFAPHLKVTVFRGAQRRKLWPEVLSSDIVVTTYPVLVRDRKRFEKMKISWLVLDEAQTIKNVRSLAHDAVRSLDADKRLALTGTPIENDLGELWALFDLLKPGLLGTEDAFRRFFRTPIETRGDVERLGVLRDRVAPYLLRRTKGEVARDLPPKTEMIRPVELRGRQRELYEHIRVAAHAEVRRVIRKKGLAASTIPILDALMKLRQVCCDPRLVAMDAARGVTESAKYDALFELLDAQLPRGRRVLVFSQFVSMLALIARGLSERRIAYALLTGQTRDRKSVCDAFERGEQSVMLISLKAGGTGLNLVSADTVVHYDPWWNPAAEAQATDRAHRIGQTQPVFVHKLCATGSVEERVMALQRRKRWLASALLGDAVPSESFSETDVDTLFAPLDEQVCRASRAE